MIRNGYVLCERVPISLLSWENGDWLVGLLFIAPAVKEPRNIIHNRERQECTIKAVGNESVGSVGVGIRIRNGYVAGEGT